MNEYLCPVKVEWVTIDYCKNVCTIQLDKRQNWGAMNMGYWQDNKCDGKKLDREATRIAKLRRD
jgi:hypothetical protein